MTEGVFQMMSSTNNFLGKEENFWKDKLIEKHPSMRFTRILLKLHTKSMPKQLISSNNIDAHCI